MTYQQLLEDLQAMPDGQLANDVTICLLDSNEFHSALDFTYRPWVSFTAETRKALGIDIAQRILDRDHAFLSIDR